MHTNARSFEFLSGQVRPDERPPWDCVLFQSENFVAIPTVGALVEGWLLVVPKQYHLCLGALDRELFHELEAFTAAVATAVEEAYGSVAFFEHGPAAKSHAVGCGVDHAHLHVLPAPCDLIEAASDAFDGRLEWHEGESLEDVRRLFGQGLPYIYVEQPVGTVRIATHPDFPSQLIRKAVAARVGVSEQYDWKEHPMLDNVLRTIETFQVDSRRTTSLTSAATR